MPPFTPNNALSTDSEYESYTQPHGHYETTYLAAHAPSWPPAAVTFDAYAKPAAAAAAAAPAHGPAADASTANPTSSNGRQRFASEQLKILNQMYAFDPAPSTQVQHALAKSTGITYRSIQIWFQNKRQRQRKRDVILGRVGAPAVAKRSAFSDCSMRSYGSLQALADAAAAAEQLPVLDAHVLARAAAAAAYGAEPLNLFDGDDAGGADGSSLIFLPYSTEPEPCARALDSEAAEGYSSPAAPARVKAYVRGRLAADELNLPA